MQGRPPEQAQEPDAPAVQSEEAGNINAVRGYSIVDAIRLSLEVGILGFGTTGTVTRDASLITAITAEGVSATFSLIIAIHEFWRILSELCCRSDGRRVASTNRAPMEYSMYLAFRLMCVALSYAGVGLIASDLANNVTTYKTTIGLALIALSVFVSRALTGSKHKPTNPVLYSDEQVMEMGFRRAQRKAIQRGLPYQDPRRARPMTAEDELVPVDHVLTSNPTHFNRQGMRPNAHFQQESQTHARASGFGSEHDIPLTTDAAEKMKQQQQVGGVVTNMPGGTVLFNTAAGQPPVAPQPDPADKQKEDEAVTLTGGM